MPDCQRADRNARRHLHDRIERVETGQRFQLDRYPEHRQAGQSGRHSRQVRRPAGAGNDHLETRGLRALGERIEPLRGAMGGDNARLVAYSQRVERLGGMPHGLPVRLAAHDDGYGFRSRWRQKESPARRKQRIIGQRVRVARRASGRRLQAKRNVRTCGRAGRGFRNRPIRVRLTVRSVTCR